jgi:transposase-like protein
MPSEDVLASTSTNARRREVALLNTLGIAPKLSQNLTLTDRAIGNLQQRLIGTHHGVSRDQLQVYLDEFVFRHNRRKQPMAAFQTLLGLGAGRKPQVI